MYIIIEKKLYPYWSFKKKLFSQKGYKMVDKGKESTEEFWNVRYVFIGAFNRIKGML